MKSQVASVKQVYPSSLRKVSARLDAVCDILRSEYRKKHADPWIIAYSGGKDSTLLLHLTWEIVLSFSPEKRRRKIYIVSNDTLVESPLVIKHLRKSLSEIREATQKDHLPIFANITEPCIDQTFWVNVIGRAKQQYSPFMLKN